MPLACRNVSLSWSGRTNAALAEFTHTFPPGLTGLVGANGSGKSTLLALLAGRHAPSAGVVLREGRIGVLRQSFSEGETIAQAFGVARDLQVLRGVLAGDLLPDDMGAVRWDLEEQIAESLKTQGLAGDPSTPVARFSGGEQLRIALAACLFSDPEILLLDEPTNNLDIAGRAAVSAMLAGFPGISVVASHDRALLEQAGAIVELSEGRGQVFGGNYSAFRAAQEAAEARAQAEVKRAEAGVAAQKQAQVAAQARQARAARAGRAERASGSQPKILMDARKERASANAKGTSRQMARRQEALEGKLTEARAQFQPARDLRFDADAAAVPAGRRVLEVQGLALPHGTAQAVDFAITGPERVALSGPNGAGKTTLLNCLIGAVQHLKGVAQVFVPFAFLDQHAAGFMPGETLLSAFRRFHPTADDHAGHAALARFGFRAEQGARLAEDLSGGERMRAALCLVIAGPTPPQLLILDEPTNHLDLEVLEEVEAALGAFQGAILVVSHDKNFLQAIGIEREIRLHPSQRKGSANSMELP
ncbi:ABC-F family ATP-binding cassette domain-containing protein [Pseudoruegeria sp. SHC-113]|uniref:ABC-F family ATP-binding cassette domain-containing protein n=1 Tax=Pseudoruegeria sp. SHC-113 TaxID=2855439 RepID=UPI0021BA7000|nr:ABC-F family ATP-binding cassette domain-containing protein [Pseudoruegeria sp. SHC-113]MCT8160582.1 ATP-binding cassette domain-containing protein [Pseudoruegeria sp. SHC-113]